MAYKNNNCDCRMDDIEYTIVLNEQGPQGRQGRQGEDGFSPSITVSVDTPSVYQLTITTKDQVINTPNLKANIPDPTFNGAVLTVNEDANLGYAWQELPYASAEQRGTVQLATDSDLTPDPEMGYNDVVPTIEQFANEITNRTTADGVLQTNIDNEATARQEADTTLQNNIDTLEQSVTDSLATKQDTLTAGTNIEITSENVINNTYSYTLPQSTAEALGGIKANARTEEDTQEIKIDTATGILYTTPTGGTGGTDDYTELENKPSINNVVLQGNLTLEQLGIQAAGDYVTNTELDNYVSTSELNSTLNSYVTTNTEQTVSGKKNFTNGASLSFTSKLTADDGEGVNEYDIIYGNGTQTCVGDERLGTTIYSANVIDIVRPDGDETSTTYENIDTGNLSENVQPLLSNLATKDEVGTLTSTVTNLETNKQDKLTAGANIQIQGNTISATDTTYTAGDGISIEGNVISATSGGGGSLNLVAQSPLEITTSEYKDLVTITGDTFQRNVIAPATGAAATVEYGTAGASSYISLPATIRDNKLYPDRMQMISADFLMTDAFQIPRCPYQNMNANRSLIIFGRLTDTGELTHLGYACINMGGSSNSYFAANYYKVSSVIDKASTTTASGVQKVSLPRNNEQTSRFTPSSISFPSGSGIAVYTFYQGASAGLTLRMSLRDAESKVSSVLKTFDFTKFPYKDNVPNFVAYYSESNHTYALTDYQIANGKYETVWDVSDYATEDAIKLNYDNTLTLNGNQLSVNSGGLNIPTATSDLTNDSGFITKDVSNLTNYTPTSGLATVATTGSYDDLTNKPTIPSEYTLPPATTTTLGGVKPDGTTITITEDGTISSVGGGGGTGGNYVTLDTVQDVGSYKTFTNGVYGNEVGVTDSTWTIDGGCLLGEHKPETDEYIPYILKANPILGGNLPLGLYIGNPIEGVVPKLVAYEEDGQENYDYPQIFYHSASGDNQAHPILDTKNFEHFITAGDGITITNNGDSYTIAAGGLTSDAATQSGDNTFTGNNTFTGTVTLSDNTTVGSAAIVTSGNVDQYAATTAQGTNADTAIANLNGFKFWSGTQAAYDGLVTKDNTTLYIITGE